MSGSAPARNDVAATLREMWETRPLRRADDGKIGGVAGAIARRYAVDPTLVRVAFVVLALSGGGLLLYLAGWALLPGDPADPPHREDRARRGPVGAPGRDDRRRERRARWAARRGQRRARRADRRGHPPDWWWGGPPLVPVVLAVVALATVGPATGGHLQSLVGALVGLVLLYGLHTSRDALGERGPGLPGVVLDPASATRPTPTDATPPDDTTPTDATTPHGDGTGVTAPTDGPRPPAWDPLGVAPFAWDLPEPSGPTPRPAPRSRVTPITLGLALVVTGATGSLALVGVPGFTATVVWASALAVVGLGLVAAAFVGAGRGLLGAAVPLTVATVLSTGVAGTAGDGASGAPGVGDIVATPTSPAQLQPRYDHGIGDVALDLRALTVPPGAPVTTQAHSGVGDVTVRVPATAMVTLTCRSGVGDVRCLDRTGRVDHVVDAPVLVPGVAPGPALDLDLESGAGDVTVTRG